MAAGHDLEIADDHRDSVHVDLGARRLVDLPGKVRPQIQAINGRQASSGGAVVAGFDTGEGGKRGVLGERTGQRKTSERVRGELKGSADEEGRTVAPNRKCG